MDRVAEQAQAIGRNAAFERALIDFGCRHDDRIGLGHQPRFVDAAKVGDDGNDRNVDPGVGAGAKRCVVEERMDRDDHIGLEQQERIAQTLAVERLAETHDRLETPPTVGGVEERTIDRRSKAKGRAVRRPEWGERKCAVRGNIVDTPLKTGLSLDFIERGTDGLSAAAMATAGIGNEEEDAFCHPGSTGLPATRNRPDLGFALDRPYGRALAWRYRTEGLNRIACRRVIETENIAELDIRISVMAVMVLGEHDLQRASDRDKPSRRFPTEVGRVPPPDVQLTQRQAQDGAHDRNFPAERGDRDVRDRAEHAVQNYGGVAGNHGMVPIGTLAVVMRTQMELEPDMLRDVVKERRGKIAHDKHDEHRTEHIES